MGKTPETLMEIRKINAAFPETDPIKDWKHQGKKVIGWSCIYMPEEVVHAAGLLPVKVIGGEYASEMELSEAASYTYITLCTFTRSILQRIINKQFDFLDGFVGTSTCHCMARMLDAAQYFFNFPVVFILSVPRNTTERAQKFYLEEVKRLRNKLEEFCGMRITDQDLQKSIGVYNRTRILLRKISQFRRNHTPPISGAEFLEVVNASSWLPREAYNQLLEELLEELEASEQVSSQPHRIRIMLSGSIMNNHRFVRDLEDLGISVVAEEHCGGVRYFEDLVDINTYPDPWEAISRRYLSIFPCARMIPCEERVNRTVKMAKDMRVEGVIAVMTRYCTNLDYDQPWLKDGLRSQGIPMLELSVEYGTLMTAQIMTRLEAFKEMLLDMKGELL